MFLVNFLFSVTVILLSKREASFILVVIILELFPFGGFMTIAEMLGQSAILTLLGMGVVFSFLIILIGCMNVLRIVVHVVGWDKEEPKADAIVSAAPAVDQKAIVAAIAAALHEKN